MRILKTVWMYNAVWDAENLLGLVVCKYASTYSRDDYPCNLGRSEALAKRTKTISDDCRRPEPRSEVLAAKLVAVSALRPGEHVTSTLT